VRLADDTGYAYNSGSLERLLILSPDSPEIHNDNWFGVIAPHDDHLYSTNITKRAFPGLNAKTIIILGVNHKTPNALPALIFDSHSSWRAPNGQLRVSSLRDSLYKTLDEQSEIDQCLYAIQSDEIHDKEHSIEALIPFLEHYNPNAEIVPIIIPKMVRERLSLLAEQFCNVLYEEMKARNWALGRDLAFLISNDCVHYGDEEWGGTSHAEFGVDEKGYQKAVQRDVDVIEGLLPHLTREKIDTFFQTLVAPDLSYRISWCGRFSCSFGMYSLLELAKKGIKGSHCIKFRLRNELE